MSYCSQVPQADPRILLNSMLPLYLNSQLLSLLYDAQASELSSRMNAMKTATDNAEEIQKKLLLAYNKTPGYAKDLLCFYIYIHLYAVISFFCLSLAPNEPANPSHSEGSLRSFSDHSNKTHQSFHRFPMVS